MSTLTIGELTIEFSQHRALRAGTPINLTPTEYRLLEYLARHAGRVVTQQELLRSIWGLVRTRSQARLRAVHR